MGDTDDPRNAEQVRFDAYVDQARESAAAVIRLEKLVERLIDHERRGNTQTVIHKTEGMGAWGSAAVCACFLTYLSLILFGVWTYFQVNNLWAWKDVHAAKISRLEAKP